MINLETWLHDFLNAINNTFGNSVWFIGLQGSYSRGEATETSDIDMVVILDELSASDIQVYNAMLDTLPHRDLICGFLSGKEDILHWDPSDLFQFYYDTKAIKGNLDELLPLIDNSVINRSIKTGICNIYHGCVHNMLYEKNEDILKNLYKSASFVIQAIYFIETEKYVRHLKELSTLVSNDEKVIVDTFIKLKDGKKINFNKMSETLFTWCKKRIK